MKIKYLIRMFFSAGFIFSTAAQASETEIASWSNLRSCQWVQVYSGSVGGDARDALYCYDSASSKTNKVVERVIFGSSCTLHNVSDGYRVVNDYCSSFYAYKYDMLPPTNVTAALSGNSINVTWVNVINPVNPQSVEVSRFGTWIATLGGSSGSVSGGGGNVGNYIDSNFLKDQYYFYNVRTCYGQNCSAWSPASNAVISYSVVPPYVFQVPKKGSSFLGVEPSPLSGTNYLPGDSIAFIAASTATQFCKEQAYQTYDSYGLADNYGNGSAFYARGAWFYHGGVAFKQLVNVHCR